MRSVCIGLFLSKWLLYCLCFFFFFQAEDGIRDSDMWLEFRRVLFRSPGKNCKTLKTWLWVFSATDNLKNLKLHHIDYEPNMTLWDDFNQNRRPKVFSGKIAIFPRRRAGKTCETLKNWLWVFSAIDNLRDVKLRERQNPKNLITGFLSNKQPEECENSPHGLRPQHESVRRFQTKLKTKSFYWKLAIFPRCGAGKTCETLKTRLWVFSAIDILWNVKLHDIDYGPIKSLWDDFSQNRRPKVFSEKIAIFPRRVPVENVKTLKTWLWVYSATDNLKNLKLHHIDYDPNMTLWDDSNQNRRPKVFSGKIAIFPRRVPVENVKTLKTWLRVFSATNNLRNVKPHHMDYGPNMSLWDDFRQNRRPKVFTEK